MPDDSSALAIDVRDCSVDFAQVRALNRVSLAVRAGEAVALLGPSGCGKTTLLRVISGAIRSSGTRAVNGRTGIVYQDLKLLPWMTVTQNVMLARPLAAAEGCVDDSVLSLLEMAAIADKAHVYPYNLSGGQKQRVAIVRALFGGADILLLDEPFSALDFVAREKLLNTLKRLRKSKAVTLVIVTHDVQDALDLADRLLVMRDGEIVGEFSRSSIEASGGGRIRNGILELYRGTHLAGEEPS